MQSTEFKLLRLFYYNLRKYFGGQSGDGRVLSRAINALARTGTILSSYLRNRKCQVSNTFVSDRNSTKFLWSPLNTCAGVKLCAKGVKGI